MYINIYKYLLIPSIKPFEMTHLSGRDFQDAATFILPMTHFFSLPDYTFEETLGMKKEECEKNHYFGDPKRAPQYIQYECYVYIIVYITIYAFNHHNICIYTLHILYISSDVVNQVVASQLGLPSR